MQGELPYSLSLSLSVSLSASEIYGFDSPSRRRRQTPKDLFSAIQYPNPPFVCPIFEGKLKVASGGHLKRRVQLAPMSQPQDNSHAAFTVKGQQRKPKSGE